MIVRAPAAAQHNVLTSLGAQHDGKYFDIRDRVLGSLKNRFQVVGLGADQSFFNAFGGEE